MEVPDFATWLHDILSLNKLNELSEKIDCLQKNFECISTLTKELKQQHISNTARIISPNRIAGARRSCTDSDIKNYYMVDSRYPTMLNVICAGHDIPHTNAYQKVTELIQNKHPVIIAGNGGLGKSSMMMHAAVQWASSGKLAVWLSLSNNSIISEEKADMFLDSLTKVIPAGQ